MKILVDEMDDGMDERLIQLGYDAYSVKNSEGRQKNSILITQSLITPKKMIITRDTESGQAGK